MTDTDTERVFVVEWPLWGLRLSDGQDFVVENTLLYQPTWAHWSFIEKTDVVRHYAEDQLVLESIGRPAGSRPPVCARRMSKVDPDGTPDPPIEAHADQLTAVVTALRMYSGGEFIDPVQTGTYVTLPDGASISRSTRVFRAAFYRTEFQPYVLGAPDAEPLADLIRRTDAVYRDPAQTNAQLALESLGLSYHASTSAAERALHRFIVLEALLGGVRGSRAGATFATRARHAMTDYREALDEWLQDAWQLRNRLAHDFAAVTPTAQDMLNLEDLARGVLAGYVRMIAELMASTRATPVAAFNAAIAAGPLVGAG